MALIGSIPRRCVNLPPGSFKTLVSYIMGGNVLSIEHIGLFQSHGTEFHLDIPGIDATGTLFLKRIVSQHSGLPSRLLISGIISDNAAGLKTSARPAKSKGRSQIQPAFASSPLVFHG